MMKTLTRKKVLLLGWLAALPVPALLMYAPSWGWVIAANVLLGINQGLAWSATVIMKIDLVGQKNRGLAMGINEFTGYLSVGLVAYLGSALMAAKGLSFYPFLPGVFFSLAGLLLTILWVKDTAPQVLHEAQQSRLPLRKKLWAETTYRHQNIGTVTINGFVNNLNDGVVWGLLPVLLSQKSFSLPQIGVVAGLYPAMWGLSQLGTGKLGDHLCKKQLIVGGMLVQVFALAAFTYATSFVAAAGTMALLGLGTALVYPNFLAVVAENTHPLQRAESLSVFRFWRDSGYVAGALLSGLMADAFGLSAAFLSVTLLTAVAGILAEGRMCCTKKTVWKSRLCLNNA